MTFRRNLARPPRRLALAAVLAVVALLGRAAVPALAQSPSPTLTIALSSALNTLDPTQAQVVGSDLSIAAHLYSSLVSRTANGELQGDLATSWRAESDTVWVFDLRSDVRFPNGEPLDAAVVKWNIDRIRDPATNSRNRPWFTPISNVIAESPTRLRIETSTPYPALPAQLAMMFFLHPAWVASNNPATAAYGTGPYTLRELMPGDHVTLAAKPDHYRGRPAFDTVTFRMIPEPSARVAGILAGEIDLAFDIPLEEIDRLNGSGRATAGWIESTRTMSVRINTMRPPFSQSVELRQALNYAIDKEGIVNGLLGGRAALSACQPISRVYFGFNTELHPYPYDPRMARELIARSGVPQPINVEIQVPLGRYFMTSEIAQVVAAQLQEVGITAQIREYDFNTWVQRYAAGEMGPLTVMGQSWPTLDADGILTLYTSGNRTGYFANPAFDAAVTAARSTTDPNQRIARYREATRIFCEQAPVVFLFAQPLTYVTSRRVTWTPRGDDWVLASDLARR
jgi:peptide/nickel transport system substrate-binding protein